MDLGLEGRVALVNGASRGIGFGIARQLAAEGASVAVSSRSRERIDAAAAELGARAYVHDSADLDAAPALVERVEADLGPLDVLVTNTGGPPGGEPLEFTRDQWADAYRELVLTPMAMIEARRPRHARARLRAHPQRVLERGRASRSRRCCCRPPTAARCSPPSSCWRGRLAADGVTLNTLLPGRIATDRLAEMHGSMEAAEEAARDEVPIGRLGTIDEIAAAGAFLCSAPASYITGVALRVDGGLTQSI